MTSLLILALFYLLTTVALILVIDRAVGIMFPASSFPVSPEKSPAMVHPPLPDHPH
jgi:hypothetical protein